MEYKCPHCGADLPENAGFCPHCATDLHPRKKAKKPVPLLKKLLLGLLALAVLSAVGFGLWAAFAPKTYDGYGEVRYGDYQVLLGAPADRFSPVPEVLTQGEPEGQYRSPSRLFVNDANGQDTSDAFLAEVETVTTAFTGQEDSPSPMVCSQPAYNPGVPECPLISLIDFTGESGTAELVWTFHMKNGDTIHLRQTYKVTPIPVYDYYPEDHPMDTAEELQALVDAISGQVETESVVNLYLPPVTYEGGITLWEKNMNLYGSADEAGNRTTFTGPVQVVAPHTDIAYFSHINFVGSGSGTGLSGSAPFRATDCTFTGWDTGVLAYATSWANVIGCTFRDNGIGFHFDSTGEYANHSMYNDNRFFGNDVAVRLDNVPTDVTLNFQGSVFRANAQSILNRCDQPLDLSQVTFE